jgi:hypothetical protein
MTLVRFGAAQLGQVTLNEVGVKRCAQRFTELTEGLVGEATCTRLGDHRSSHVIFICGGHVWMAPLFKDESPPSHRTSTSTCATGRCCG